MMSLLQSVSPADLTARNANNSFVLSSQDQALDGLEATTVLLKVQTDQLARARDQVARKRAQADAKLLQEKQYKEQAASARDRVATSVRHKQHAWAMARRARAHDQRILAASKARADRVHRQLMAEIAREQHRGGGYTGPTGGLLMRPVNGPITSPYGYRINPVMHYYGLHDGDDFGAACGTPIWSAGNGHIMSEYYSLGLGPPALPQPRPDQRQERHRDLQPPVGLPHPRRPGRRPRAGGRTHRYDGLVDRLPHPHDGDGQRRRREPRALDRLSHDDPLVEDQLINAPSRRPETMAGCRRSRAAR